MYLLNFIAKGWSLKVHPVTSWNPHKNHQVFFTLRWSLFHLGHFIFMPPQYTKIRTWNKLSTVKKTKTRNTNSTVYFIPEFIHTRVWHSTFSANLIVQLIPWLVYRMRVQMQSVATTCLVSELRFQSTDSPNPRIAWNYKIVKYFLRRIAVRMSQLNTVSSCFILSQCFYVLALTTLTFC